MRCSTCQHENKAAARFAMEWVNPIAPYIEAIRKMKHRA